MTKTLQGYQIFRDHRKCFEFWCLEFIYIQQLTV